MIDPSVSLGALLTMGVVIATAVGFVYMVKADARVLAEGLRLQTLSNDRRFGAIEDKLDKLSDVVVVLAKQDGRINIIDDRMLAQGKRLDELQKVINKNSHA